jgi:asparaginyl-tRNA synthetase
MPKADRVKDILGGTPAVGERATVQGWIRTRRDSKAGLSFLAVHDGSAFPPLQVVAPAALPNYESEVLHLTTGCAVEATGTLAESQGKGQSVELVADGIRVIGWVEDPDTYPIQPKQHSFEYLREVAHLRPRTNTFGAMARVRHALAMAMHEWFDQNGYSWIHTPIITASDAEGAGELFRVSTLDLANLPRGDDGGIDFGQDFFGKPAFLTVSGQLNVEAYALALTRVYTFGPTFRAENSNTSRHLAEFWMVEPEIAFADIHDNADVAEALLKHSFRAILDRRPDDMAFFAERIDKEAITRLEHLITSEFVRMEYAEAIEVLERAKRTWEFPVHWGVALQAEHERYLCEDYAKRPVVVINYPKEIKAFYMRSTPGSARPGSTRRSTGGTATSAATGPCPTPGSASASTGRWPTRRAWPTSAT